MTMPDAEKRATDHFDKYVGPVVAMMQRHAFEQIRHHYITSQVHGVKHGREDVLDGARQLAGIEQQEAVAISSLTGPGPVTFDPAGFGAFSADTSQRVGVETAEEAFAKSLSQPQPAPCFVTLGGAPAATASAFTGMDVGQGELKAVNLMVKDVGEISDGYHTFNELYEHRNRLFIALMTLAAGDGIRCWRSRTDSEGEMFSKWFVAGIDTPAGQITYHLPDELWGALDGVEILERGEWDGHTSKDVVYRLGEWAACKPAKRCDRADGLCQGCSGPA